MKKLNLFLKGFKAKNTGSASACRRRDGFTLIEILVVIGIIAILAAIVIVAINPARQFAQARNTQRTSNVETILNAIGQNLADNKGIFTCAGSGTITNSAKNIGDDVAGGDIDLACLVPTYISTQIPVDPSDGTFVSMTNYDTEYTIKVDSVGRYTICAPGGVEAAIPGSVSICLTR